MDGENKDNNVSNNVGTQANQNKDEGSKAFKVFQTEDEYNKAVNSLLKSKLPPKSEMDAFKTWKESQKTAEQIQAEKDAEYQRVVNELKTLQNSNIVRDAGVKKEFIKFVTSEVGQMNGDFKENLTKYLKENTQYTQIDEKIKTVGTSAKLSGEAKEGNTVNQMMNDIIRSAKN